MWQVIVQGHTRHIAEHLWMASIVVSAFGRRKPELCHCGWRRRRLCHSSATSYTELPVEMRKKIHDWQPLNDAILGNRYYGTLIASQMWSIEQRLYWRSSQVNSSELPTLSVIPTNPRDVPRGHYVKRRHPQNRKYITYRNAVRGGPNQGHKNWWSLAVWFSSYASGRTNRQTDILITIFRSHMEGEPSKQQMNWLRWRSLWSVTTKK